MAMKELAARHRGICKSGFASCGHGDSRTVRGVISPLHFSSAWIAPVSAGGILNEPVQWIQTTGCVCGVPSYLVDLDERLEGYTLENPVVRRSSSNELRQVRRRDIVNIRSRLLPDLQL